MSSTKPLPAVKVAGEHSRAVRSLSRADARSACNVAPIFLDTKKTVEKTIRLIEETAKKGADLVVFPEAYIPGKSLGYPLSPLRR